MHDPKTDTGSDTPQGSSRAGAGGRDTGEFLGQILHAIGDPVFVKDRQHRFILVNDSFCAAVGRTRPELLGRSDYDFFPKAQADVFWQRDDLVLQAGLEDVNEETITGAGGVVRTIVTKKTRFTDGDGTSFLVGVIRDITERRQQTATMRASERRHRMLFESSRDAIMILAPPEWRLTGVNSAARAMFAAASQDDLDSLSPLDVSAEHQPDGRPSADKAPEMIEKALGSGSHFFEWTHRRLDGRTFSSEVLLTRMELDGECLLQASIRDITERRQAEEALRASSQTFRSVIEASPLAIVAVDQEFRVTLWNPAAERIFGWSEAEVLGQLYPLVPEERREEFQERICAAFLGEQTSNVESRRICKDGTLLSVVASLAPLYNSRGEITAVVGMLADITEKTQLELQLRQAQKLESIGQLAAGIAHEINTPTQYVGDNTRFLKKAFADLTGLLSGYLILLQAVKDGTATPELVATIEEAVQEADFEYLTQEIPAAISQTLEGVERVTRIVRAMKDFSHPDSAEKVLTDLNKTIESTLTVARNEWKYSADMVTDFDPELPMVPCLQGEFNQVILNLVINASHAIRDVIAVGSTGKGTITVSTRRDGAWAEVRVRDTGAGIPEAIRGRIFDPFFTTKGVGKGTGQGLAISRQVMVNKHGGSIDFQSEVGVGTTFILRLPLGEAATMEGRAA
jgi:PAS domain S-box-containing protein